MCVCKLAASACLEDSDNTFLAHMFHIWVFPIQAALEAQRDAEQSQLQAEASMHLERERNCRREEELLAQQSSARTHPAMADGELEAEVAKLQLVETRQREEINK